MGKTIRLIIIAIIVVLLVTGGAIFLRPTLSAIQYNAAIDLGNKHITDDKFEDAVIAFNKAIKIDAKQVDAYLGNMECYQQLEKPKLALATLKDALNGEDRSSTEVQRIVEVGSTIAEALLTMSDTEFAVECYLILVKLDKKDVSLQVGLAKAYVAAGNDEKALAVYERLEEDKKLTRESAAAYSELLQKIGGSGTAGASQLKVGMVTDAGTIDDKFFNQGTWEGVVKAADELKIEKKYLKPVGPTEADYLKEIQNLYDAGFKLIVCPGFKFETTIFQAQDKYADAKFVLIDGSPNNGKFDDTRKEKVGPNTVSIFFAEHEAGFIAGVATAVQIKEGDVGFIGGMEIPPVQKFNWGFQQGVKYANANYGTNVMMNAENVIYQGTFSEVAAGQQLAAQMFDKGVKVIFAAAGGVGVGVINEAKIRADAGKEAWIVGVDVDQYADGIYNGEKSIILTSAMKRIDNAAHDMVVAEKDGKFPGGQTLLFEAKNDGVGIPTKNPNLSADAQAKAKDAFEKVKSGAVKVAVEQGGLIK